MHYSSGWNILLYQNTLYVIIVKKVAVLSVLEKVNMVHIQKAW